MAARAVRPLVSKDDVVATLQQLTALLPRTRTEGNTSVRINQNQVGGMDPFLCTVSNISHCAHNSDFFSSTLKCCLRTSDGNSSRGNFGVNAKENCFVFLCSDARRSPTSGTHHERRERAATSHLTSSAKNRVDCAPFTSVVRHKVSRLLR